MGKMKELLLEEEPKELDVDEVVDLDEQEFEADAEDFIS